MTIIDFDGTNKLNGVFYFWTQSGENLSDLVEVTTSQFTGTRRPSNLLDHTESYWRNDAGGSQWVSFHFLKHNLALSRYSLWNDGSNSGSFNIKDWFLEGSNDNSSWSEIDRKENPTDSCTSGSDLTFVQISPPFCFFRLTKTNICSSTSNVVRLRSIEFFGTLNGEAKTITNEMTKICHSIFFIHHYHYPDPVFLLIFILSLKRQ